MALILRRPIDALSNFLEGNRYWAERPGGKGTAASVSYHPGNAEDLTNRKNMALLIQLRWIAFVGQIATIAIAQTIFQVTLPLAPMFSVIGVLIALNLASAAWLRTKRDVASSVLFIILVLDVAALTIQLFLSGGATNPFIFLYLLQVILGAVLLRAGSSLALVGITCVCFIGLTYFYRPLELGGGDASELFRLYIFGSIICFVLDSVLLVVFVSRVNSNLRERDARLASLRQQAAEEEHIVRMGLLASGAAHELGTPLASLSVILGDWRKMPALSSDPEMLREIDEMQAELLRCKSIVTGVLLSAGEARGDSPGITTVNNFLDSLVHDWRNAHSAASLQYTNDFGTDVTIVADTAITQVLHNILDNALEASPHHLEFVARRDKDALVLHVADRGPGFASDMLAQIGKPYRSSKGKPGGGLGLFLVVNVVRKLGGSVSARNGPEGGAIVTIELPIEAIAVGAPRDVK
jgi:two-component system, sensor histidine kinase RegB